MKLKSKSYGSADFRLKRLSHIQLMDKGMSLLFTLSGWAVMLAVIGMGIFFLKTVLPLGKKESIALEDVGLNPQSFENHFIAVLSEPGIPFVGIVDGSCLVHLKHKKLKINKILNIETPLGPPQKCYKGSGNQILVEFSGKDSALLKVYFKRLFDRNESDLKEEELKSIQETGFAVTPSQVFVKPFSTSALAEVKMEGTVASALKSEILNAVSDFNYLGQFNGSLLFSNNEKIFLSSAMDKTLYPITHHSDDSATSFLLNTSEVWRLSHTGHIEVYSLISKFNTLKVNMEPMAAAHLGFPILAAAHVPESSSLFFVTPSGHCGLFDLSRFSYGGSEQTPLKALWLKECGLDETTKITAVPRGRIVVTHSQKNIKGWETTTGRVMFDVPYSSTALKDGDWVQEIQWSENGLTGLLQTHTGKSLLGQLKAPHPEASWKAFFMPVHYEGYEEPGFIWQSTGSDTFQPKYSLIPLMWGTLKATFYAMIFAAPLAIFAAVYSSEILDRKTRNHVKPAIEMMASLPSVVLGYIAALYVAPWVEKNVVSVLCLVLLTPTVLYTMGHGVSRLSSHYIGTRGFYSSRKFLVLILFATFLGLYGMLAFGRWLETTAFGGDVTQFLSGGSGHSGVLWGLILLPVVFGSLWSIPMGRYKKIGHFILFCLGPWLALGLGTWIASSTDPRDIILGPYAQRNTLVVALVMGFAIVPIVYSIAEDALTSVPSSLRAASLACGASVWQTTARVVIPTAASGLFTAITIGFGRAIGETMIAVMAAGNSPTIDINPFEGLRSLSANIAVELPEATFGGTHYRVLFLSALILFLFTFALNSLAEILRSRFRARSQGL